MRVICAYCKTDLGEQCPKCGGKRLGGHPVKFDTPEGKIDIYLIPTDVPGQLPMKVQIMLCLDCGDKVTPWTRGLNKPTHVCCAECLAKNLELERKIDQN